ncbi:FAD-binding protein [Picosynechococcus sp. PCC 11901]|uniref:NAD(P)/FAD-dependent oxidoreductase n=1 Tax=Picosynechococcus sp. PCC 11901 TaxID=2579791 RepID=UPI0010FC076D|nr:FAD-dependent oxidoreductase [Picosynechococcus sp. PCC 11901]QCS49941.1 FAD-binding protein [Picosynechococcus sp. PCC 11901]
MLDVAIIGAGLAGIHCGQKIQQAGQQVALFDKSRGVGGRLATRRIAAQPLDHGLPYWEILGAHTAALTETLVAADLLKPWSVATTNRLDPEIWQTLAGEQRWMVPAGMTAIAKYLAQDLTIHRSQRLICLEERPSHWRLIFEQGETVCARQVVLALPLPQVITLTYSFITVRDRLAEIFYAPALSLMVGYDQFDWRFPWQALRLSQHPRWRTISYEGQKRSPGNFTLVCQTTGNFAQNYLETADLTPVATTLLDELQNLLTLPTPQWWQIQRWRYALPATNYGQAYYRFATNSPLIACGDWCLGNGIEGAIAAGLATGDALLSV